MALARFALKNLQQRVSLLPRNATQISAPQLLRRLSSAPEEKQPHEVAVADGGKKSKLSPRRRGRRAGLWRRNNHDFGPAPPWELFPSGLGNVLVQATENINRLMENLTPSHVFGGPRVKEHDGSYELRYQMPGLGKDDVKVTVEDGVLNIRGEHSEETGEEGSDGNEFWSAKRYGYYDTSVVLPDDAKVDGVRAEMKDGVLNIVVPKSEKTNREVKEVEVQ